MTVSNLFNSKPEQHQAAKEASLAVSDFSRLLHSAASPIKDYLTQRLSETQQVGFTTGNE